MRRHRRRRRSPRSGRGRRQEVRTRRLQVAAEPEGRPSGRLPKGGEDHRAGLNETNLQILRENLSKNSRKIHLLEYFLYYLKLKVTITFTIHVCYFLVCW